jgi:hypothetical protein
MSCLSHPARFEHPAVTEVYPLRASYLLLHLMFALLRRVDVLPDFSAIHSRRPVLSAATVLKHLHTTVFSVVRLLMLIRHFEHSCEVEVEVEWVIPFARPLLSRHLSVFLKKPWNMLDCITLTVMQDVCITLHWKEMFMKCMQDT